MRRRKENVNNQQKVSRYIIEKKYQSTIDRFGLSSAQ